MASESLINQLSQPFYDDKGNPNERFTKFCSKEVPKIIIDGNEFTGYKTYSFFWEKTYVKEPTRSSNGSINNLNSYATFITPHLQIKFALMSMEDYRKLYNLILSRNEFVVTCYNPITNGTTTNKMYFYPDSLPKLNMIARNLLNPKDEKEKWIELLGVQDYTIEMVGTNVSMDKVEIRYYDENDNLIANSVKSVDKGVETIVNYDYTPTSGYRFDGKWQKNDVEGAFVFNGSVITPTDNIKLKAVVKPTNQYTLLMDYGVGIKPTPQDSTKQVDSFTITYEETLGSAISNANITLDNGNNFEFPSNGTGVAEVPYNGKKYSGDKAYEFSGWYWTTEVNSGTQVNADTTYDYKLNRTIHQIYTPKSYAINFNTNDTTITLSTINVKYNEKVVVPQLNKSGINFKGWYWTDKDKNGKDVKVKFNGIMPPFTLNLYAKWEKN